MKKKWTRLAIISLIVVALPLVLRILMVAFVLTVPRNEMFSRLAWYHNTGYITLTVDGEAVSLDGLEIMLMTDGKTNRDSPTHKLKDGGVFHFRQGDYGPNLCDIFIPAELWGGDKPLQVQAQFFSANSWQVNHFCVFIDVQDGEINASGYVMVKGDLTRYELQRAEEADGSYAAEIFDSWYRMLLFASNI